MTTISTQIAAAPDAGIGEHAIPFRRLLRTELRKLTDTRANPWLLIAIVVMLFAMAPKDLTYNKFVDYAQTPQKILLPSLGILGMTSEWSQRTGLVTFTLVPNRRRVFLAKFTALLSLGLAVTAITFAACAAGNMVGAALRHGDGSWTFGLSGFAEITLVQFAGLVEGMAFGMALLVSAAALVTYYVGPTLWSVLFALAGPLKRAGSWLDLNKALGNLYDQAISGTGWLQIAAAATPWILIPLAIGSWRVSRAEMPTS